MIDPSKFVKLNVADTCSIWNVLASRLLYAAAQTARVSLCLTQFVRYECFHKVGQARAERSELQARLKREISSGKVTSCRIDLEDLQDIEILQARGRLSKGELSSIVFAKKTQQAFLTDDRKAARLAAKILRAGNVQSTPHLIAWLYFLGNLQDSDKNSIVKDLAALGRNLQPHLENAYQEALRCRLATYTPILAGRSADRETLPAQQQSQNGMSSSEMGDSTGGGITKSSSPKPS
jgi:predicted nucleic acid-binding protein